MKHFKITVGVIILMLMLMPFVSFAAKAQEKGIHEPGTGIAEPELREAGQGTGQGTEVPKAVPSIIDQRVNNIAAIIACATEGIIHAKRNAPMPQSRNAFGKCSSI